MAKISDAKSFSMQPLQKKSWIFQFSKIPGNSSAEEELAFVAHTCKAPSISYGDVSTNRFNEKSNYLGSPEWADIDCAFYDFIRKNSQGSGAGDILYNWSQMVYNGLTGQQGYKTQYATSATLAQLDPAGNIIRAWNLYGIMPKSINFGDGLDYSSSEVCEITCTFKYDFAIKVADAHPSSQSA